MVFPPGPRGRERGSFIHGVFIYRMYIRIFHLRFLDLEEAGVLGGETRRPSQVRFHRLPLRSIYFSSSVKQFKAFFQYLLIRNWNLDRYFVFLGRVAAKSMEGGREGNKSMFVCILDRAIHTYIYTSASFCCYVVYSVVKIFSHILLSFPCLFFGFL